MSAKPVNQTDLILNHFESLSRPAGASLAAAPAAPVHVQPPIGRAAGRPGGPAPPRESSPPSSRVPPASIIPSPPTEGAVTAALAATAGAILSDIGRRFVKLRENGKPEAWRRLQADIMAHLNELCPAVIPLKDALSASREIEDFLKGGGTVKGKSTEEVVRDFLLTDSIGSLDFPLDNRLEIGTNAGDGSDE